jgi:nitrogen fixation NifU-like protein
MEVFLSVVNRIIRKARFDTLGCGYTVACGDIAMEMAEKQPLTKALSIRPEQIGKALGGLPASHEHCAALAVKTLRSAIHSALERGRDPWKKLYG